MNSSRACVFVVVVVKTRMTEKTFPDPLTYKLFARDAPDMGGGNLYAKLLRRH